MIARETKIRLFELGAVEPSPQYPFNYCAQHNMSGSRVVDSKNPEFFGQIVLR